MTAYTGEIADLIREHGYAKTAEILEARRDAAKEPSPTPGDAYEGKLDDWHRVVEENSHVAPVTDTIRTIPK